MQPAKFFNSIDKQKLTGGIGHVFFLILGILSLIFYKERMFYYDPAYFSFCIINDLNYSIALGRWGAFLSQVIPVLAVKSHLSIESVLQLYSVSFIIVYYLIFNIIQYILKDTTAAIVYIFSLCLTFRVTFYYPTAELYHGIALSILFWSVLKRITLWEGMYLYAGYVLSFSLVIFLSYFHQLTVFLVLFFIAVEWIYAEKPFKNRLILIGIVSIVWFIVRIKLLTVSDYEKSKVLSMSVFWDQLPKLSDNITLQKYFWFLKHEILMALLAFFASLLLIFRKHFILAIMTVMTFISFSIIVIITLYRGESVIMTENYFTVLGVFMSVPIVLAISNYRKIIYLTIIFILCGYSLAKIYQSAAPLTNRVTGLENMINYGRQFPQKKFIVRENNHSKDAYWSSLFLPFETLLLSSLKMNDIGVSYFILKDSMNLSEEELNRPYVFLGPEWSPFMHKTNTFNLTYFNLPGEPYLLLSSVQDTLSFNESDFNKDNFLVEPLRIANLDPANIYVKITNLSEQMLPSIPGTDLQIYLSYHLIDDKGNILSWDNKRTPIDFDLHSKKSLVQKLNITHPGKKGKYYLHLDMVTEGKRWWGIDSKTELILK